MGKKLISIMAMIGMTLGSMLPTLFGDNELLDGWSILGGLIGGIVGIWLGAQLSKRF